ncbi:hypothetical protein DYB38_006020 [Aphanomyces astaci]|uniref:Pre-rRNA-processing protein Ipi1 N-terminal domain-containing protein n=1 Tax=Aphanomyces astaci TaxID=112090 RepID=A0A397D0Z7_APHAT|nr:hypothetical protein DYB38_006020 [Aphanomyces astaci]
MANLKGGASKGGQKKKPGDFKRPKRKVGRKVVQSNVTNASIQSRRINMTEQSMLQDKSGAAVTHRNQTLQDILSKASHYNAHVRRDAMSSLKELIRLHPMTLVANIGLVLERLLQVMVDDEAIVREACVATWKDCFVSLASSHSEQVVVPFAQLILVYFCSGLTHLKPSVREDVLRHINAVLDIPAFALLLAGALSPEQCGRLLENFKDSISTKASTVHVKNSYSLFAEKAKVKQSQLQSSVLKARFFAVEVVHKLLQALDKVTTIAATGVHKDELNLTSNTSLLLVSRSQVVGWSSHREPVKGTSEQDQSWPAKALALLPPLLGLWMECHGDDNTALPPTVLTHLILIVEASTIIIRASTLQADDPALKVYAQTYFTDFPRAPMEIMSNADSSTLHFWSALNLSIAQCGCECFVGSNAADLDDLLTQFVQSEFDNLVLSEPSVRQVAQGPTLLKGRLQLLTSLLERGDHPELLEAFTTLYMSSVASMSWSVVSKWMGRFGLYMLAIVDSTQQDTFKAIFRVSIGVLTRLPPAELESEHMASWLTSVVAFFTSTTNPVWFGQLPWSTQLEAVALLHHLPTYPPAFLRTLAACCKAEILHKLDRGALLNFYMSTLFAQGNELLCPQVCRLLSGLNFGSSLSSILAPTLAKQSVEGNAVALVMAFVVCLKSNAKGSGGEKQRTPDVLKTHLVASFVKVLVTPQLEAAYSTLVYEGMQIATACSWTSRPSWSLRRTWRGCCKFLDIKVEMRHLTLGQAELDVPENKQSSPQPERAISRLHDSIAPYSDEVVVDNGLPY